MGKRRYFYAKIHSNYDKIGAPSSGRGYLAVSTFSRAGLFIAPEWRQ